VSHGIILVMGLRSVHAYQVGNIMLAKILLMVTVLLLTSEAQAASLVRLRLGSNADRDLLQLTVLFRSKEEPIRVEVRAYESLDRLPADPLKAQIRPIEGRGDQYRDSKGAFLLKVTLAPEIDTSFGTADIEIEYEQLKLAIGSHHIGYEVTVFHGDSIEFTTATSLKLIEILDQPRDIKVIDFRNVMETKNVNETVFVVSADGMLTKGTVETEKATSAAVFETFTRNSKYLRPNDIASAAPAGGIQIAGATGDGRTIVGRVVDSQKIGVLTIVDPLNKVVAVSSDGLEVAAIANTAASPNSADAKRQQMVVAEQNRAPWIPQPHIPIYYATNRNVAKPASRGSDRFGNELANLSYGSCLASVPLVVHRRGRLERPGWWDSPDPSQHFLVEQVNALAIDPFFAVLKTTLSKGNATDVLLYIHGFNNTFEDCILTAAQIKQDTEFSGTVVVFSWPSEGVTFNWSNLEGPYKRDENKAKGSYDVVASFIQKVIEQQVDSGGKIHILSHSMGGRVTAEALQIIDKKLPAGKKLFGHLVFAAPDVDAPRFGSALPAMIRRSNDVTLYYCEDNLALMASRRVHSEDRAGQGRIMNNGLECVDCKKANTSWLGHGYLVERDILLVDLQMLLMLDRLATNRRPPLRENVYGADQKYWFFP
jgi:esterase/lipase superfamily enzyme